MLKNILNISGVQKLKKETSKKIKGGFGASLAGTTCESRCSSACTFDPFDAKACKKDCAELCK